jgi:hypothetical protein
MFEVPWFGVVRSLLIFPELNRPLRSGLKGRQEEILPFAGKMRTAKDSLPVGDV